MSDPAPGDPAAAGPSAAEVVRRLREKADPADLAGMARFGMWTDRRLGVSVPDMRAIAKGIGKDHELAVSLWQTGIAEARIVASMVAVPERLTAGLLESWVTDVDSWDVCDQLCMNLLEKSPLARSTIAEWSTRDEEFVRRTAFALIACLAWHDKKAPDGEFIEYLAIIERGADDGRNFVKKAVSWALRTIGKRNAGLNRAAIETAERIRALHSKPARCVAADALRELTAERTQQRLGIDAAVATGSDRSGTPPPGSGPTPATTRGGGGG